VHSVKKRNTGLGERLQTTRVKIHGGRDEIWERKSGRKGGVPQKENSKKKFGGSMPFTGKGSGSCV